LAKPKRRIAVAEQLPKFKRVVTAADSGGRSYFETADDAHVMESPNRKGLFMYHVWGTSEIPCPVGEPDQSPRAPGIMPPKNGSVLHVIDYPPEPKEPAARDQVYERMRANFRAAGTNPERGVQRFPDDPHPGMHATDTIDYAIVLSGEIFAVMDAGETLLKQGDVLIQRGTRHAWSNRSDDYCRVAFVLVEATP
jgi:hypothetical protein